MAVHCPFARILAVSTALAREAGEIIRRTRAAGLLDIVDKGVSDYQTKADRDCQQCIIGSLNHFFPSATCIGEEDDLPAGEFVLKGLTPDPSVLSVSFPETLACLGEGDITVWVDPLDGTKEYTEGGEFLEHVTVLIGLSSGGKPLGGIIHQPYFADELKGRTVWGAVGVGAFGLMTTNTLDPNSPVYTTTRSHFSPPVAKTLDALQPCQIKKLGGSGRKVLAVLDKEVTAYVYPSLGCKRWDTCAPEAVLRAVGGYLTDVHGLEYDYSPSVERMNWMGILAAFPPVDLVDRIPSEVKDMMATIRDSKKK